MTTGTMTFRGSAGSKNILTKSAAFSDLTFNLTTRAAAAAAAAGWRQLEANAAPISQAMVECIREGDLVRLAQCPATFFAVIKRVWDLQIGANPRMIVFLDIASAVGMNVTTGAVPPTAEVKPMTEVNQ